MAENHCDLVYLKMNG